MKNMSNHFSEEEQIQVGYGPVYDLCISIAFLILFVVGKHWGKGQNCTHILTLLILFFSGELAVKLS